MLVVAALVLTGCAGSSDEPERGTAAAGRAGSSDGSADASPSAGGQAAQEQDQEDRSLGRYVALGDSYTSAPWVGMTDLAEGCLRSPENYPALLAKRHPGTRLVDVSCAGATTRDVLRGQRPYGSQVRLPAQLDAVTPDTDLVTVGIGGNDDNLFAELARSCLQSRGGSGSCVSVTGDDLDRVGDGVRRVLRAVRDQAPEATVVLVGYPRILDGRGCPDRLPVPERDVTALTDLLDGLRDVMADAADDAGAEFLDLHRASDGHDVCSDQPWVNGAQGQPMRAMALHPLAAGQQAAARLLDELLAD